LQVASLSPAAHAARVALSDDARARGVRIDNLPTLIAAGDPVLRTRLGAAFAPGAGPVPGTIGTYIEIPEGAQLDEPIVIEYRVDDAEVVPYTLVVALNRSRATIVERVIGGSPGQTVRVTSEVLASENADVTYAALQYTGDGVRYEATRRSNAADAATTRWCLALLGGSAVTDELIVTLGARAGTAEVAALFFPTGKQSVELATTTRHVAASTNSNTIVRSIAAGHGRGRFYGNINIGKDAHLADASLRDDVLIFGQNAHIDAIPALEIAANDVKAFHGATVGAIDDEHIFYVMSRGIDRTSAEKLIALGFFEPAIARFPGEALRDELRGLLEAKLAEARA
jgi:Fe-S cluster assembly protein SufD